MGSHTENLIGNRTHIGNNFAAAAFGIGRVKPVDIGQNHRQIGTDIFPDQCRQNIVIGKDALAVGEFVFTDHIVFVDDRNHPGTAVSVDNRRNALQLFFLVEIVVRQQKLSVIAERIRENETASKIAIIGALELYLDFINIFLALLRLFGKSRK